MKVKRIRKRNWTKVLLGGAALAGLLSAVGLLASNFQIYEVSSGSFADSKWPSSESSGIVWNENFTSTPSNVTVNDSVSVTTVLDDAFSAWHSASYNSSSVTTLGFTFGTASLSLPSNPMVDCKNVISFSDSDTSDFPAGVIAVTLVATIPQGDVPSQCTSNAPPACPIASCIVDADIVFNPAFDFATASPGMNQYDLQSVATHEIGHMVGLDHSGIAHAVMFPYGDTHLIGIHQQLWYDDMLGVGHLYPGPAMTSSATSIEGSVTVEGSAAYAAQVEAIDSTTGNVVSDTLSNPSGDYQLFVFGGSYYVYVQPLGQNSNWAPTTIDNYRGQAGYGDNNPADIPSNATNYTGVFY